MKHRFLGGEDCITAPIPPGALCDDRRPEPRDFSGFYYASPELRCHDGVTSKPFVKKINVEHDYQTIDVEQEAVTIRQAMEELKRQQEERQAMITVMQTRFELDQRGYHPDTDPAFSPTRMDNMREQHRRDMPPPRMTSSRDMPLRTSSYVRAERPKKPLGPPPGFEPFRPPPGYEDFKREEFRNFRTTSSQVKNEAYTDFYPL